MKQADNNEVDILLRSLARRIPDELPPSPGSTSASENRAVSDHLDADELNSYAEGVVPALARARYTEHLADCETCRRIVVGLTQAAGAATQHEVLDRSSGVGFWHKFAALFSPTVLRYAVPALVLTAVIAISMMALRKPRHSEFVAQNEPTNSSASSSEPKPTELRSSIEAPPTAPAGTESPSNADSKVEKKNLPVAKNGLAQASGTPPDTNKTKSSLAKDSPQPGQAAGIAGSRPSFAPEPASPAAAPSSRPFLSDADKMRATPKEQPAGREDQELQRKQNQNQPSEATASQAPSKNTTVSTRRIQGLAMESKSDAKDKKESLNEVETRNVSGRHFRRQGNVWVDTAYESSRATINVARGSEHFRSLVADEPGIRAIADQLSGEVVVVWKGRAYRIH